MSSLGQSQSSEFADTAKILFGTLIIFCVGFLGIFIAPLTGLTGFWPIAGLWGALGWGTSRVSLKPVIILMATGFMMDISLEGPFGCWTAVLVSTYLIANLFRKDAESDGTGLLRLIGVVTALVSAFLFSRWIMGAYTGGINATSMLGNFLTTALLYLPLRPLFAFKSERT